MPTLNVETVDTGSNNAYVIEEFARESISMHATPDITLNTFLTKKEFVFKQTINAYCRTKALLFRHPNLEILTGDCDWLIRKLAVSSTAKKGAPKMHTIPLSPLLHPWTLRSPPHVKPGTTIVLLASHGTQRLQDRTKLHCLRKKAEKSIITSAHF